MDKYASGDRPRQRPFNLTQVEAEDDDLNAILCAVDSVHERHEAIPWLQQESHPLLFCAVWHPFCSVEDVGAPSGVLGVWHVRKEKATYDCCRDFRDYS